MGRTSTQKLAVALTILAALALPHFGAESCRGQEPSRLEFRILADIKHDHAAAEKARAPDGLEHPPAGYRWVWLGEAVLGSDPKLESKRLVVPGAHWKENEFAGGSVRLTGKNLGGFDLSRNFEITQNTAEALQLRQDPLLFFRSVSSFGIDLTPSRIVPGPGVDVIIREVPVNPGRLKRSILVKVDTHNVSEKDLIRVVPDVDEFLKPAIRFEFSLKGGRKFGALTRAHLPETGGTFKYQLGIILDGRLLSAPVINSEIRESGIIELGRDARPEEVDRIIKILRTSSKQ
jgi:SecD/SecF fusion protein